MDTVSINGHEVPGDQADRFFSAKDGRPLTDAEWDESKRRRADAPDDGAPSWAPIGEVEQ